MFRYLGDNKKLKEAAALANDYEILDHIRNEIAQAPKYDYSDVDNHYIAKEYFKYMRIVWLNIKVYYPKYRWSKAMGYFSPNEPTVININGYMIDKMQLEQLVSLFYHESAHSWNESDASCNVHHGNNSAIGKENTMMYSINRYVYEFYNYEYNYVTYTPWYKRIINFLKWW